MTCKDCIHNVICSADAYFKEREGAEAACVHFKPKSRFIELPCAVGDTVYVKDCAKPYIKERKISKIEISDIGMCLYSFGFGYPDYLIGKTVFLTKEEAEEAEEALERSGHNG